MLLEKFLVEAENSGIEIREHAFKNLQLKGLYVDNVVTINSNISTNVEKICVIAEEIGHHHTSTGNILDQSDILNRKQEKRARTWAYQKLIPLSSFVQAHRHGIKNKYELAEYLGVTESFLEETIKRYQEIYGLCTIVNGFTICFDPLGVLED